MSESLPYRGVTIVAVIRYAVVAQACSSSPLRSSAMVRMAVATMVWSRAARNMPIIRPTRMVTICLWVMSWARGAVAVMSVLRAGGGEGWGHAQVAAGPPHGLLAGDLEGGGEPLEVSGEF